MGNVSNSRTFYETWNPNEFKDTEEFWRYQKKNDEWVKVVVNKELEREENEEWRNWPDVSYLFQPIIWYNSSEGMLERAAAFDFKFELDYD